jgi:hypothetical protein
MSKFNSKLSANNDFFYNLNQENQFVLLRQEKEGIRTRRLKRNKWRRDIDAPFAVFEGDPQSIVSTDPNVKHPRYHVVHHSKFGKEFSRGLKQTLRRSDSGYEKVNISSDSYKHDPELFKLAPHGMEAFRPAQGDVRSSSKGITRLVQMINFGSAINRLNRRKPTTRLNPASDEPTDPLNLIIAHGGNEAIRSFFTDQVPYLRNSTLFGNDLCVCGRSEEKHVSPEEAKAHFDRTGQHLEIHPYLSQEKTEERISNSPLLGALYPPSGENVTGADYRKTDKVYTVRLSSKPMKFSRYAVKEQPLAGGRIQKHQPDQVTCPEAFEQKCFNGKKTPNQRDNITVCPTCEEGHVVKHIVGDELRPATLGLGNGKFRYLDPDIAPKCPGRCDNGEKTVVEAGTKTKVIPCRTCGGPASEWRGKDFSPQECITCNNRGFIPITDNNNCPTCNGTGKIDNPLRKSDIRSVKTTSVKTSYTGNPYYPKDSNFTPTGNTGVDLWKAHGDPNCTRCHGDDEFQTENAMPCNCRIARSDDKESTAAPAGMRFIYANHVDIPVHMLQKHIQRVYGKNPAPMQNISSQLNTDEIRWTNEKVLGVSFRQDSGERIKNVVGHFVGGWSMPKEAIDRLNNVRNTAIKSKNYGYTGSSVELEAIEKELNDHFHEYSMNSDVTPAERPADTLQSKIQNNYYHPEVRPAIQKIRDAVFSAVGNRIAEYDQILDKVLDKASYFAESKRTKSPMTSMHEKEFIDAKKNLLRKILQQKSDASGVLSALSDLPSEENNV